MGQNNSRASETINWNQIKTNEMSSTIPNMDGISNEARELVSRLNLPEISESNSEFNINSIVQLDSQQNINNNDTEIDNAVTSPFISSEMYNYLVNKYNNNSIKDTVNMTGGGKIEEDSETSATSSSLSSSDLKSSPSETDDKPIKKQHKKEKHVSPKKTENSVTEETDNHEGWGNKKNKKAKKSKTKSSKKSSYTGNDEYLSYVSSSAHTGGSLTESVANENNYTVSTVNTSDINMISE
jgi:hypothetical protein